jgi:hypothetical protein
MVRSTQSRKVSKKTTKRRTSRKMKGGNTPPLVRQPNVAPGAVGPQGQQLVRQPNVAPGAVGPQLVRQNAVGGARRKVSKRKVSKRKVSKRKSQSGGKRRTSKRSSKSKKLGRKQKGGVPLNPNTRTVTPAIQKEPQGSPLYIVQQALVTASNINDLKAIISNNISILKKVCPSNDYDKIANNFINTIDELYNSKQGTASQEINKNLIINALNEVSQNAKSIASSSGIPYIPNIAGIRYALSLLLQGKRIVI